MAVGDQHIIGASLSRMAAIRCGSVTRSTTCSTPASITAPRTSPGSASKSVKPVDSESPQTGDRLAAVARVRSRRSVDAWGVVRSCGKDAAGLKINDLQRAEHPGDVAPHAGESVKRMR